MNIDMRQAALEYAERGWAVIPTRVADKRPVTMNGSKDATTDAGKIREWWERFPQSNVAICTGNASGIAVVDVDERRGIEALAALGIDTDASLQARTGRDGFGLHIYYRIPEGVTVRNAAKIVAGVDVRGDGGYVNAPPSIHASGRSYEWTNDEPLENYPEALLKLTKRKGKILSMDGARPSDASEISDGVAEGSRNDTLFRWACRKRGEGASLEDLELMIPTANQRYCKPPLPDDEIADMARRICDEYEQGNASGIWLPLDTSETRRWAESMKLPAEVVEQVAQASEAVSKAKAEQGSETWQVVDIVRRVIDEEGGCHFSMTIKLGDKKMTMRGIPAADMMRYGSLAARALGTANGFAWPDGKTKAKELMLAIKEHMRAGIAEVKGSSEESASALAYAHLIDYALQLQETEEKQKMMADNGDFRYHDESLHKWVIEGESARHMVKAQVPEADRRTLAAAFERAESESVRYTIDGKQRRFTAIKLPEAAEKPAVAKLLA